MVTGFGRNALMASTAIVCMAAGATPAMAQAKNFDVPAQSATTGIAALGRQADIQIVAARRDTRGKQTKAVRGDLTVEQALAQLLQGTGLTFRSTGTGTFSVYPLAASNEQARESASPGAREASAGSVVANTENSDIVVTGTHIRGGAPAGSPLRTYNRQTIDQTGAATIGEFARTMTENLATSTSQAYGYGNTAVGFDQINNNAFLGSGFNLHGISSGATLTLINGKRMSGGGSDASFVDVSSIPLSAVQRIEVLGDGGSAVYGADAIAGVVNVILKKDYSGAETSVRVGLPTRGGGREITTSQLAGASWATGNIMGVYEYDNQNPIGYDQRDFVAPVTYQGMLTPKETRQSFFLSGHQLLDEKTILDGSFLYSDRSSNIDLGSQDYLVTIDGESKQYTGSIGITRDLSGGWTFGVSGNVSRTQQDGKLSIPLFDYDQPSRTTTQLREGGAQVDGPLFSLGAEPIKLALGGGYRNERVFSPAVEIDTELSRNAYFLYGELLIPLFSPSQGFPWVNKLELSVAGRYDHYSDFGSSTNPKIGLTWSPTNGLEFRGSYSTSFRAPLLTDLDPRADLGRAYSIFSSVDQTSPSGNTAVLIYGGNNPNLRPETATTFSAGFDYKPSCAPNLSISATYFRVSYDNRIAVPPVIGDITSGAVNIFQQTALAPFISRSVDPAAVSAIFSGPYFGVDYTGAGPTAVGATFDDRKTNIAGSVESGIEGNIAYQFGTSVGNFALSANATYYIDNKYKTAKGTPSVSLLDLLGQPPRFRARGGVSWSIESWGSSLFVNRTNSYQNPLFTPYQRISEATTVDFQVTYHHADALGFTDRSGFKISLNVQNLFDADPPRVAYPSSSIRDVGFDAVNASPVGRLISLQITKTW